MEKLKCWIDGSCYNKTKRGGIGIYFKYKESTKEISDGCFTNTTNNQMELLALIVALKYIKNKNIKIIIYSDSQYVVNSINKGWLENWELEGRVNSELWKEYLEEISKFPKGNVEINWVRGHLKDLSEESLGNNVADGLARKGYKSNKLKKI